MKATEKQKEVAVQKPLSKFKYTLTRKSDNLVKEGNEVCYVYWKGNGTFQSMGNSPSVGASLALDLEYGVKSTHITDQITSILEASGEVFKFETKDGLHELTVNK